MLSRYSQCGGGGTAHDGGSEVRQHCVRGASSLEMAGASHQLTADELRTNFKRIVDHTKPLKLNFPAE